MITPIRFENGDAMLMVGIRRQHAFADASRDIAAQWRELMAMNPFDGRVDAYRYGIICGAQPDREQMEYMTALHVSSFERLPASAGRLRVPAQRYAVFTHVGPMSTLHLTWNAVWNEWLPLSGLVGSYTPDFERYAPDYDFVHGTGAVEIWYPISVDPQTQPE